jgi:hypothetical protein
MPGLVEVLVIWAAVGGLVVLWLGDAAALARAPRGGPDPTECACCRHDAVTHRHGTAGTGCTPCPCWAFRAACR